uniref:Polymerase nucleotidyl transferase domain-containing protein n=1 Tax=Ditylenchus dipsaci TaxID=166011 RepID=A0A915CPY9_9BILA
METIFETEKTLNKNWPSLFSTTQTSKTIIATDECKRQLQVFEEHYDPSMPADYEKILKSFDVSAEVQTSFLKTQLTSFTSKKCESITDEDLEQLKQYFPLVYHDWLKENMVAIKSQLSMQIMDIYKLEKQAPAIFELKKEMRDKLQKLIRLHFPDSVLHIVGSSQNGFGNKESDLDLGLITADVESYMEKVSSVVEKKLDPADILSTNKSTMIQKDQVKISSIEEFESKRSKQKDGLLLLYDKLKGHEFVSIHNLKDFRTPIITMTFHGEHEGKAIDIHADMSFNSPTGVRNTQLLLLYSNCDDRVAPLVSIVKKWAKNHSINSSKNTLKSFSWVLMVIHYLQSGIKPAFRIRVMDHRFLSKNHLHTSTQLAQWNMEILIFN